MRTFREFLKTSALEDQNIEATEENVSFTNKNGKKFVQPIDDLEQSLQALWKSSESVKKHLVGDWKYEESKFRQAFGAAFGRERSNSVATNLGSQTPNTVRCLELYAYYRLSKSPTPKLEKPDILSGENLDALFYVPDLAGEFQKWLLTEKRLSEKSVSSYSGAVSGLLSECAGKKLLQVSSPAVFASLREMVLKDPQYIERNNTGNQMYSAALNHYSDFLNIRSAGTPQKAFAGLCAFCRSYNIASEPWMRDDPRCDPAHTALKQIQNWAQEQFGSYGGVSISVEVSKGAGHFPKVPWVCLLPEGQKAADGVYVSVCFGREGNGAVAGFAESVSSRKNLQVVKRSEQSPLTIDVDGASPGTKYNDSFENPQEFRPENFNEGEFRAHLAASLDRCLAFLGLKAAERFGPGHRKRFCAQLESENVRFKAADGVPEHLITALVTKPFVILTGNSGTGKTRLAELFVQWLSGAEKHRFAVVPVGADWTDNRNVLGFVNHLRTVKVKEGAEEIEVPIYQSTRILDLLLEASRKENETKPFFLILDEMNLSHVERYFADFLSTMESKDGGLLLHREGRALPRKSGSPADVQETLPLPRNVFVIGTVNVDETTYMFSPKVLDRANVLEFRVAKGAPQAFLASGGKSIGDIAAAPAGYAEAFLELSYRARGISGVAPLTLVADPENLPKDTRAALEGCHTTVTELFALMQERHQEFAFRTMAEIHRFLAVDYELTADKAQWNWKAAMDAQILQKILPKLHGSRTRLAPLLGALAQYCATGTKASAMEHFAEGGNSPKRGLNDARNIQNPQFKESYRKLERMIVVLVEEQFVSFIC